jgi:two-component system cell cycle sensor histidine kinase/response regulator CckA
MQSAAETEPLRVLVVDDDSALIRTLSDILRLNGYDPATAETGSAGLRSAQEHSPALAVIDLRLPDMDGMELAAKLHQLSKMTEVVVLTGNASLETAVAAMREHSVDYLVKPVDVKHLLSVANAASERWQRRRAEERLRESDEQFRRSLEVRARQQAAVASLGHRALSIGSMTDLLDDVVQVVAKTLDLPYSSVLERRSDGESLVYRAFVGWTNVVIGSTTVALNESTQAGYTYLRNQPALVTDLEHDTRFSGSAVLRDYNVRSGITVLVPGPGRSYGVLEAHDSRQRDFTQDDIHFMQAIAHVLGTALERQRGEAAFRQAQRLEAVGRLASGVAHDFNNMLTAITGYGEILRAGFKPDDPMREDVDEILGAAQRAAALTKQLLAFSRQSVLQPRLVVMNEVVRGIYNMLTRIVGSKIEFRTSLDPDLGLVKADPSQMEQVILNLCVNARDAMPHGGTLELATCNVDLDADSSRDAGLEKPGKYIMIAVTDSGIGMDAETRVRIFEPFFSTKPAEKGTGLGLATVYGIVKQSGGDIWVYSEVGRGTTFKVFLPRVDDPLPDEVASMTNRGASPRGSETVLLADDEAPILKVSKRILEGAGYHVLTAPDGAKALDVAAAHKGTIDLLVTDMVMPHLGGRQLADKLRAERPGLRVLYLSGYTDTAAARQGLMEPGAEFLQKPFSTDSLVRRVREVLDSAR